MKRVLICSLASVLATIPIFAANIPEHKPAQEQHVQHIQQKGTSEPYKSVTFEVRAMYDENRLPFLYADSLAALRERGYQRHPRPAEVFSLYFAGLEGKIAGEQLTVFKNMAVDKTPVEWLSMAMYRDGDMLYCYEDPTNIKKATEPRMDAKGNLAEWYADGILQHSSVRQFQITGLVGHEYISVNELPTDLVVYLYSREYKDFPTALKGENAPLVMFPNDGELCPVSRSTTWCGIGSYGYLSEASRGVLSRR